MLKDGNEETMIWRKPLLDGGLVQFGTFLVLLGTFRKFLVHVDGCTRLGTRKQWVHW